MIAGSICPWALSAQRSGRVRICSSEATEPEEVLLDLLEEAEALPCAAESSTTLLVCPYVPHKQLSSCRGSEVKAWEAYEAFRDFYEEDLAGGNVFLEELGMKVVAFHPKYLKHFGGFGPSRWPHEVLLCSSWGPHLGGQRWQGRELHGAQ